MQERRSLQGTGIVSSQNGLNDIRAVIGFKEIVNAVNCIAIANVDALASVCRSVVVSAGSKADPFVAFKRNKLADLSSRICVPDPGSAIETGRYSQLTMVKKRYIIRCIQVTGKSL